MSAKRFGSAEREFIDTNVLVYAFDTSAGKKQATARDLIHRLWESGTGCLSVQVLQEFFVASTRKVSKPLSVNDAVAQIRNYSVWRVFSAKAEDVVGAIELLKNTGVSYWDAMIILRPQSSDVMCCGLRI